MSATRRSLFGMLLASPLTIIPRAEDRNTERQHGILHVKVGSPDWEPTTEELQSVAQLFQAADPERTVIATRHDVVTNAVEGPPIETQSVTEPV